MRYIMSVLACLAVMITPVLAEEEAAHDPTAVFAPIAGKTWRGEGTAPDGKPIVDVAYYEYILGGRALQSTHKLEGETLRVVSKHVDKKGEISAGDEFLYRHIGGPDTFVGFDDDSGAE